MRKWHNLIIILIIMSLFGCRTMNGKGSAAGAGTYPLKPTPAAEDTVLLTVVDATKAGGFDIRRTPVANMPVSTPVSAALALKQNASSAITESDVQGIVDAAVADIDGGTITADTTDPTKAAAAVSADSATYATTAGTAGTVAAVSGDAVTSGTVADNRIASTIARDLEVTTAVSITATGFNGNLTSTDDTIQELAQKVDDLDITAGTITADTTDPTKAAVSVLADTATTADVSKSVDPEKTSGMPGMMSVYEADGTSTLKTGFIGPANSTVNFVYQFPNEIPSPGDTWVAGTALTGQTLPDGSTGTIIPLIHAAGGGADVPDGTLTNDILSWDGDSWEPIALTAHPAFASLLTAFTNAGLNSFTFDFTSPIYTNDTTPTITVDVADTSTTYAVNAVNYKLDAGSYAAMTNTTGDTWSVTLPTQTDGAYDLQFNAADDKSTPNTGESAAYPDALIVDLKAPVIEAGADGTHDGSTPVTATIELTELYPDPSTLLYTVTGGTPASGTWTGTYPNYSLEVTPTGTDNIVVTSSGSDLAGNAATGTDLSQTLVYSGAACTGDFSTGANESFESAEDAFCTTDFTVADTSGVISTYDTSFYHTGAHGASITLDSDTEANNNRIYADLGSNVDTGIYVRYYVNFPAIGPLYADSKFLSIGDDNNEGLSGTATQVFSQYQPGLYKTSLRNAGVNTVEHFVITPGSKYRVEIYLIRSGASIMRMFDSTGAPVLTNNGGSDYDVEMTAANAGVRYIVFRDESSSATEATIKIDDIKYSTSGWVGAE